MNKGGAPKGEKHGKVKHPFDIVQSVRARRERNGWSVRRIARYYGIPADTVNDWIYHRTRGAA